MYAMFGSLHAAVHERVRAIRAVAEGQRGQGTVEYVGLELRAVNCPGVRAGCPAPPRKLEMRHEELGDGTRRTAIGYPRAR